MPILNMVGGGQKGGNIGEPLNLSVTSSGTDAIIKWEDNEIGTIPPTSFQKSELVRKVDSAPSSPSDGTLVVTETVKDTYKTNGYVDQGLTAGTTYYYRVFSYSDLGGISYCDAESVTPGVTPPRPTITGFSYDGKTLGVSQSTYGDVNGMAWKPDGTKFYITGESKNVVYQFSCSTAWDVSTGTYDSKYVATGINVSAALWFSDDGQTMWIGGGWSDGYVYKFTLSTAWDVSTATYVGDATGKSNASFYECSGYCMADDGNYLYVLSRSNNRIRRYTMATPYDVTTLQTGAGDYQEYTPTSTYNHKVILNPQGTQLFYYARNNKKIHICALSTPFDLTTISETSQYTVTTPNSVDITSVAIDNGGNSMYIGGYNIGGIYQYSTTTA